MLLAAREAFASEGVDVPLDEIARRAGVGPGTVHRHFPAKADLVDAVLAEALDELAEVGRGYAEAADPGGALVAYAETLAVRGAALHELARDLRADVLGPLAQSASASLQELTASLLARAQAAGRVRPDLDTDSFTALVSAAHAAYVHPSGGADALRMVLEALRPG